jgi:hypothetical protein
LSIEGRRTWQRGEGSERELNLTENRKVILVGNIYTENISEGQPV